MKRYLKKTDFKDKADCIADAIARAGVTTINQLENMPGYYGAKICNEDIYSVIFQIREASTVPDAPPSNLRDLKLHEGVTDAHLDALESAGIKTVDDALKAGPDMAEVEGIGKVTANRILATAKKEA